MDSRDTDPVLHAIHADTVRRRDAALLERLLPERMKKARSFRFERDRLLCMGAGFLLLEALGLRDESALRYGGNGKPFLPDGPAFNLSHSGQWCVLAVGAGEIGVDIEQLDERNLGIAPMVCTPDELAWMRRDPLERFHTLWTWKESVMKATGLGVALEPGRFEVLPFASGMPVLLRKTLWYARSGTLDGYRYSVCASRPFRRPRWVEHGSSGVNETAELRLRDG